MKTTIVAILFIISGIESTSYPFTKTKEDHTPNCYYTKTSSSFDISCRVYNINELRTLQNEFASEATSLKIIFDGGVTLPSSFLAYSNLTSLDIQGIGLMYIHDQAFKDLEKKLTFLSIDNTKLSRVPFSLTYLTSLHTLNLGSNRIASLDVSLRNLRLRTLSLFDNKLSTPPKGKLPSTLETLILSKNCISHLNGFLRGNFSSLKALYISDNSIVRLAGELIKLPRLKHLHVEWNLIESIDDGSLAKIPHLQSLFLSHNRIRRIDNGLRGMIDLRHLDLSHNGLADIHVWAFKDLANLHQLHLQYNSLRYLTRDLLNCLPLLDLLDVRHNDLKVYDFMLAVPFVKDTNSTQFNNIKNDVSHCNVAFGQPMETARMSGSATICISEAEKVIDDLKFKGADINGEPCRRLE